MEVTEYQTKAGYKLTKLGWIPEDWDFDKSEKAIKYFGGAAFKSIDASSSGVKWLKIANVGINKAKWDEQSYLPGHYQIDYKRYLLKQEEIVMALTRPILNGQLKITKLEKTDVPALLNQRVARVEVKEGYDSGFIYYLLQTPYFVNLMEVAMAGTDPPNIGSTELGRIKVPLPPLAEQQKIAQILSTWDQAIIKTEQLIAKKQQRKKGLMQQLLTGKKRFSKFVRSNKMRETKLGWTPEDWAVKELGELGHFLKGKGVPKAKIKNIGQPCLTYGELYTRHDNVIREFYSYIDEEAASDSQELMFGDILFAGSGETLEEIGKSAAFVHQFRAFAGGDIVILRSYGQSPEYLGYLLNHDIVNRQKYRLGQGHSVVHIYSSSLKRILVPLSSVEEQVKITSLLLAADDEIEKLGIQLTKLKDQKKGLMQKLLTGEIRTIS